MIAIGKINDIFNGQGITDSVRTKSNMDGVDQLLKVMKQDFMGLSFTSEWVRFMVTVAML